LMVIAFLSPWDFCLCRPQRAFRRDLHRTGAVRPHNGQRFSVVGVGAGGEMPRIVIGASVAQPQKGAAFDRNMNQAASQRLEGSLPVGIPKADIEEVTLCRGEARILWLVSI